jgi:PPOX class probable F420-dependent enzyme
MGKLDDASKKMLQEKNFAFLATINANGTPQVTPVWVDTEDDYVLLNTAMGRVKQKNTKRDPRVAIAVIDVNNPYHYTAIRGRVLEQIEGQRAEDHIDKLAKKYLGKEKYPWRKNEEKRVLLEIEPEQVSQPQ